MKILKLAMAILICSILAFTVNADESIPSIYQYSDPEVTVCFPEPLDVSAEFQQEIADAIAGFSTNTFISPDHESLNNIICTLFGHDIAPQGTVTATHHKVEKYNPRCLMEVYHVTYCKRCDYAVSELANDFYIVCCPED